MFDTSAEVPEMIRPELVMGHFFKTQPNPTHGWTQPMTNSGSDGPGAVCSQVNETIKPAIGCCHYFPTDRPVPTA